MISLGALLVFLVAASLPVIYVLLISRWLEPESRRSQPEKEARQKSGRCNLIDQHA